MWGRGEETWRALGKGAGIGPTAAGSALMLSVGSGHLCQAPGLPGNSCFHAFLDLHGAGIQLLLAGVKSSLGLLQWRERLALFPPLPVCLVP